MCMKSTTRKSNKTSQDSKLIRITLVISIFTLLLALYTFYSVVVMADNESHQYEINQHLNKRSAENRRAVARLVECQVNPENCDAIDWERPYHSMRDVSEKRQLSQ